MDLMDIREIAREAAANLIPHTTSVHNVNVNVIEKALLRVATESQAKPLDAVAIGPDSGTEKISIE